MRTFLAVCLLTFGYGQIVAQNQESFRHTGDCNSVAYSPDGNVVAGAAENGRVFLWDAQSGRIIRVVRPPDIKEGGQPTSNVCDVAISPNGKSFAVTDQDDGMLFVHRLSDGRQKLVVDLEIDDAGGLDLRVRYSPDGNSLFVCGSSGRAILPKGVLLDATSGKVLARPGPWKAQILNGAFSPDGRTLVLGTLRPSLRVYDVKSGRTRALGDYHRFIRALAVTPDGKTVLAEQFNVVVAYDLESGEIVRRFRPANFGRDGIVSLKTNPKGDRILAATANGWLYAWEFASAKVLYKTRTPHDTLRKVAVSPDGKQIAAAGDAGHLTLWNFDDGSRIRP